MNARPDIVVSGTDGRPVAVVEVKNRTNLTRELATALRERLSDLGPLFQAPYFLLVSQDKGYLWTPNGDKARQQPTSEFPMGDIVARYLPKGTASDRLQETVLEQLVAHWLMTLTDAPPSAPTEPERSLAEVGFLTSVQGGTVAVEAWH
jgi:hypothetical protein